MEFKIKNRHRLKHKDVRHIIENLERDFESNFNIIDSVVESGT